METLSCCVRIAVFWTASETAVIFMMTSLLNRRRPLWLLVSYLTAQGVIQKIGLQTILYERFAGEEWWELFYSVSVVVFVMLTYLDYCLVFEGSALKIGLTAILGEINFTCIITPVMSLVNSLEGRPLFTYRAGFMWPDLLILPLCGMALYLEGRWFQKLFPAVRKYEPKGWIRKALWLVLAGYLTMAARSNLTDTSRPNVALLQCVLIFPFCIILILFFLWTQSSYRRQILYSRQFLERQQELMRLHYQKVAGQIESMEDSRKVIDRQMAELSERAGTSKGLSDGLVRGYLLSLNREYEKLRSGVFLNDWMVDAVLCYMGEICRKEGISYDVSFGNYARRNIREADTAELIFFLLDAGVRGALECKSGRKRWISLRGAAVKNRLILEFACGYMREKRKLESQAAHYAALYDGEVYRQKGKEGYVLLAELKDSTL